MHVPCVQAQSVAAIASFTHTSSGGQTLSTRSLSSSSSHSMASLGADSGPSTPADILTPIAAQVAEHRDDAVKSASSISRADLTELRMQKVAPQGCVGVFRALVTVVNHSPCELEWLELRKEVSDQKFLQKLKDFDPTTMTPQDRTVAISLSDDKPMAAAAAKMHKWLKSMLAAHLRVRCAAAAPAPF